MNFLSEESGQGVVEYAFVITLCAIIVCFALKCIGGVSSGFFEEVNKGFTKKPS